MPSDIQLSYVQVISALLIAFITYVVVKAWPARRFFYRIKQQGLPLLSWNPITGNFLSVLPIMQRFPADAHQTNYLLAELSKCFPKTDVFYLDMWPFAVPLIVISSPPLAIQACQEYDLEKPEALIPFFRPFAGGDMNLFTMNGPEWKKSRSLFNPGFNANYLLSQTNHIVEETTDFVEILREHAQKGEMFSLDDLLCNFTMDIIGAVSLNSRLHSQREYNQLASSMRSQVKWHLDGSSLNVFNRFNPVRPLAQWYNGLLMDRYISKELDKRFSERQTIKNAASRSIIDLVLDNYMTENPSANSIKKMDLSFKKWATIQIRLFLFAGHDSTASTICYCYHMLWKHPEALAKIRAEHDEVFGKDISTVASQLLEQPQKVNRLPYTNAVLKEASRLFPAASAMRTGARGAILRDPDGNQYPTEGTAILVLHSAVQRNPKYWKDPDTFIPERWLVGPEDPLYPPKGGWRPFEFGPRNCVGQALVTQDVKTVLAMTVREFDIRGVYDEWDKLHPRKGLRTAWGERAYQVFSGAAHPADGFPCRISMRQ